MDHGHDRGMQCRTEVQGHRSCGQRRCQERCTLRSTQQEDRRTAILPNSKHCTTAVNASVAASAVPLEVTGRA